ncbi:MAG: hypothetical protein LUD03_01510 [Firmicutes bacterium]|nr:hypothetical protein [Bacillota bacterium]
MKERKRSIQVKFYVDDEELKLITLQRSSTAFKGGGYHSFFSEGIIPR